MNDIDFLPADYVCIRTTRSSKNWLGVVMAAAFALMLVGWFGQQHTLRELTDRRNHLQEQTAALLSILGKPEKLRSEIQEVEGHSRLLDALRLNVPPTRWLSAVVESLPAQVALREMKTSFEETAEPASTRPNQQRRNSKPVEELITDPVARDLDRLSKSAVRQVLVISLNGTAADDHAVSSFLNSLNQTGLFDRVQLLFTDQLSQADGGQRTFAVRMRVSLAPGRVPASNSNSKPPSQQIETKARARSTSSPVASRGLSHHE